MIKNDEKTEMEHKHQWTYQLSKKCQVNNNHSRQKLEELMHIFKKGKYLCIFLAAVYSSRVFVAAHGLSFSQFYYAGFSLQWILLLQRMGSGAHRLQ